MLGVRERIITRNNLEEMSRIAYQTTPFWDEEWVIIKGIHDERKRISEKIRNKFEIFSTFYPIFSLIIALVAAVIMGVIMKRVWIAAVVYAVLVASIVLLYRLYYDSLKKREAELRRDMDSMFYRKYGRSTIKKLLAEYGETDKIPPRPKKAHDIAGQINFEELMEEKEVEEKTEEEGVNNEQEAEEGRSNDAFDLHLNELNNNSQNADDSGLGCENLPDDVPASTETRDSSRESERQEVQTESEELLEAGNIDDEKPVEEQSEETIEEPKTTEEASAEAAEIRESQTDDVAVDTDAEAVSVVDADVNNDSSPQEVGDDEVVTKQKPVLNTLSEFIAYYSGH